MTLVEGSYALSTPGFHTSADWAARLGFESTSAFPMKHGKTLAISYGGVKTNAFMDASYLFTLFFIYGRPELLSGLPSVSVLMTR